MKENGCISRGTYYLNATGELEKAVQVFTEYARAYPSDAGAHGYLGATLYQLGQFDKSATECRKALRLNPDNSHENITPTEIRLYVPPWEGKI